MSKVLKLWCFLFGHEDSVHPLHRAHFEPRPCSLCGGDARETWEIEMDTDDRIERLIILEHQAGKRIKK